MVAHPPGRGSTERGATSIEYALMASLIAAVVILAVTTLGEEVARLFSPELLDALLP